MGSDWGTAGGLKLCVALERDCVLEGCTLYVNHNKVVKDCFAFKEIQDSKLNEGIKLMVRFMTFFKITVRLLLMTFLRGKSRKLNNHHVDVY